MVEIVFETHSTTTDNEANVASGLYDCELSKLGRQQATELGDRRGEEDFDVVYCSDLKRAYQTCDTAFYGKFPIIRDKRLRDCDYGELTGKDEDMVRPQKLTHIDQPFPGGQSFKEITIQVKSLLEEILQKYDEKRVMIVGHRATQYALENLILGKPLEEAISAQWEWQPGWVYQLEQI